MPESNRARLTLAVAVFLAGPVNVAFWSRLLAAAPIDSVAGVAFAASVWTALTALFNAALTLVSFRWVLKPAVIALLLIAAPCGYFMSEYGLVIDRELVQSALETDAAEVADLLTPRLFVYVFLLGVLPALVVARTTLHLGPPRKEFWRQTLAITISLAVCMLLVLGQFKQFVYVGRENPHLRQLINPLGPIQAALRYASSSRRDSGELVRIGLDARRPGAEGADRKPNLVVLVVGETARAANFALNGYPRETNPRLSSLQVISFTQVRSCGTATATSLPCMFSAEGRTGFDASAADEREGLLDVLQRAGVSVLWRDNNSGCKHTCDRVPAEFRIRLATPELCNEDECYDEVLLRGLQERINRLHGDALIVLHQLGSHGPAYHKRSPDAHKVFRPECAGASLQSCPRESIVNAYDNSIVYTDWLLAQVIEILRSNAGRFDGAMLYLSDHGESLGEGGVYLHGLPWLLAPDEQTLVPMILWISEPLRQRLALDLGCLERRRHLPLSHDHLFHSMLGLFGVSTVAYRGERDMLAPCRGRAGAGSALSNPHERQEYDSP